MKRYWTCYFSDLIDLADSNGGHILMLGILCIIFLERGADAYLDLAVGALLMKLKDAGSNRGRTAKYDPNNPTVPTPTIEVKS